MTLRRLSTAEMRRFWGSNAVGWSRRSRLRRTGRARCARTAAAASRSRGVATGGKPRRAATEASTWRPAATRRTGGRGTGPRASSRRGCDLDRRRTSGRGGPGSRPRDRPPSQGGRWSLSGDSARRREEASRPAASRVSSRRRDALGSSSDESITVPDHAGSQRACRLTNLAPDAAARSRSWSAAYPPRTLTSTTSSAMVAERAPRRGARRPI